MKTQKTISILLVVLAFAIAVYFFPVLPEKMATHWNLEGNADGFMPKTMGLFLIPAIMLLFWGVFQLIPQIDPLKQNIAKFRPHYDAFITVFLLFLLYIQSAMLAANQGISFNMMQAIAPGIGILLFFLGTLFPHLEKNWFIGIRTPWTLSNETVWKKTHLLGAKLFKASGIISFFGVFFPEHAFFLILAPVIASALITVVYSYLEFRKHAGKKN